MQYNIQRLTQVTMETDINFFATIDENSSRVKTDVVYYTPTEAIVFGSFTPEECSKYQGLQMAPPATYNIRQLPPRPSLSPSYFRQIQCARCGYSSHTIENCIARRNIYGEFIMYPAPKQKFTTFPISPHTSPPSSETHYYNHHLIRQSQHPSDKTDYTQFIFTEDEVIEWIDEERTLMSPPLPPTEPFQQVVYVPMIVENHSAQSSPSLRIPYYEEDIINYAMMCSYAMANYMFAGNMYPSYYAQ